MVLRGTALIDEINATRLREQSLAFWWLGQHSFILKTADRVFYIDPYLSPDERRRIRPLLQPNQVTNADYVLLTHDHRDHIDPTAVPGIAASSPQARFVVSRRHRRRLRDLEVPQERLCLMDPEDVLDLDGARITAVRSKHEFFENDEDGWPFLGFVVEQGRTVAYHCGDGVVYEGLVTTLRAWKLTVMFLPINGRDAERYRRNTLGNMTYQEAADLAGALAPRLTVPGHFDMFEFNGEDPQRFADYMRVKYPQLAVRVCEHGERVELGPLTSRT